MKNHVLTISAILILSLISCNDDNQGGPEPIDIENSHLTIDEIKSYLPSAYKTETGLIYVNEAGIEKKLHIDYVESLNGQTHHGLKYTSDVVEVIIYDSTNIAFSIVILGGANYTEDEKITKGLNYQLMPFNDSGTTSITLLFKDGEPEILPLIDFRETLNLYDKIFNNVFVTKSQQFPDAYSELDINKEVGVVAFRDENNDLWVFDRFED